MITSRHTRIEIRYRQRRWQRFVTAITNPWLWLSVAVAVTVPFLWWILIR